MSPKSAFSRRDPVLAWVQKGLRLRRELKLNEFRFSDDAAWVAFYDLWFRYREDLGTGYGVEFNTPFDSRGVAFAAARIGSGQVFIDIGANFGIYSLLIARLRPGCRVHAIEANPLESRFLAENVRKNGLQGQVAVHELAITDRDGHVRFTTGRRQMCNRIEAREDSRRGTRCVRIRARKLDTFVTREKLARVDFIKCDIEGAELQFLRGAEMTLRKFRPKLLLEIDREGMGSYGGDPEECFAFLKALGYAYRGLNAAGATVRPTTPKRDLSRFINFYFYPVGRVRPGASPWRTRARARCDSSPS